MRTVRVENFIQSVTSNLLFTIVPDIDEYRPFELIAMEMQGRDCGVWKIVKKMVFAPAEIKDITSLMFYGKVAELAVKEDLKGITTPRALLCLTHCPNMQAKHNVPV